MKIPKAPWPSDQQSECIKAFAERVLELTDKYVIASYRHRTLATNDKATELSKWVGDVKERLVPKPTLNMMIEEYNNSIQNDPIVQKICEARDVPTESITFNESASLEKMEASLRIYRKLIHPDYGITAKFLIERIARSEPKKKSEIISLAESFVPYVITSGMSREFLHITAKREFFLTPQDTPAFTRLMSFLREISVERRKFDILLDCDGDIADNYKFNLREEPINLDDLPMHFKSFQKSRKGNYFVLEQEDTDPFSAARTAKFLTTILQSTFVIFPSRASKSSVRPIHVYERETGEIYRVPAEEFLNMGSIIRDQKRHRRSMREFLEFAFHEENGRKNTRRTRVLSALTAASSASNTQDPNACLALLWSAFEGLLPLPTRDGQKATRIIHFANIVTPLSTAYYTREIYNAMHTDLLKNYRDSYPDFLKNYGDKGSLLEKFLSIFHKNEPIKRDFTSIFSDNQVLRIRAKNLDIIANDPKKLTAMIDQHRERVKWQLHRIYRERNDIVHNAAWSKYARGLIENGFSYFQETNKFLLKCGTKYKINDIDSLVELCLSLNAEHDIKLRSFKPDESHAALMCAVGGPIL